MAYARRSYTNELSKWKLDDINNIQDGIDEAKSAINTLNNNLSNRNMAYTVLPHTPFANGVQWTATVSYVSVILPCVPTKNPTITISNGSLRIVRSDGASVPVSSVALVWLAGNCLEIAVTHDAFLSSVNMTVMLIGGTNGGTLNIVF